MAVLDEKSGLRGGAETIFALSSGQARAGISVIRLCGPAAGSALDVVAGPVGKPRLASFRRIRDPRSGEVLDEALTLWFPGPRTETGEDMAELHVHGSPAVVRSVLQALASIPGCRPAGPGEFARRAFENGKLDLTAVEGLADLIDAETDAQRRQALRQMQGGLAERYESWRARLIEAQALVEAAIDFSDESDVAQTAAESGLAQARQIAADIARHLDDGRRGEIVRDGFRVVLAGSPNAGKSSLMNALAQRDVAIVSAEPGTTRDVLEVRLDLGGYPVVVSDTAGLREAAGEIEREGIRRALRRAEDADLVLWIMDAAAPTIAPPPELTGGRGPVLAILNKIDLVPDVTPHGDWGARLSAKTGRGIGDLVAAIAKRIADSLGSTNGSFEEAPITQTRHRQALEGCVAALEEAGRIGAESPEVQAELLRRAATELGRIIGRVDPEDVLDQIFGRFCIGK